MEFWDSVAILRRRWYIVVPGLILTLLGTMYVVRGIAPVYQATGTMVLLPTRAPDPGLATAPTSTTSTLSQADLNAMNNFLTGQQFANLVALATVDPKFRDDLVAAGGSPSFEVRPPSADLPIITIPVITLTSSAATPEAAVETYRHLVDAVKAEVLEQQEKVGPLGLQPYRGSEQIIPTTGTLQGGARTKAMILLVTMGVLLTVAATFLVDSLLNRRNRSDSRTRLALLNPRSPLDDVLSIDAPDDEGESMGGSGRR